MTLLILGLLVWASVHFIPSLAQPTKIKLKNKIGAAGYQGAFALVILLSLAMIIFGWRSTAPVLVYSTPVWMKSVAFVLMLPALILFVVSNGATRIKQFIRHPQLTAVILWSIAHLLSNGDVRSIVLFGGLGLWAVIEIMVINRREGQWRKPEGPTWAREFAGIAASVVIFVVVIVLHPYISGVAIR